MLPVKWSHYHCQVHISPVALCNEILLSQIWFLVKRLVNGVKVQLFCRYKRLSGRYVKCFELFLPEVEFLVYSALWNKWCKQLVYCTGTVLTCAASNHDSLRSLCFVMIWDIEYYGYGCDYSFTVCNIMFTLLICPNLQYFYFELCNKIFTNLKIHDIKHMKFTLWCNLCIYLSDAHVVGYMTKHVDHEVKF